MSATAAAVGVSAEDVLKLAMSATRLKSISTPALRETVQNVRIVMGLPQFQLDRMGYEMRRRGIGCGAAAADLKKQEQLTTRAQTELHWIVEQAADRLMDSDTELYALSIRHTAAYREELLQRVLLIEANKR